MTAHAAEFFTWDDVNRLKIIQDVVDRCLTTQMAAQRLSISDRQCRRILSRYRKSGPFGMANRRRGKPSNNQLPDGLAQYALNINTASAIPTLGRRWRVRNSQNCTMFTCPKRLSVHSWSKPLSGSPANDATSRLMQLRFVKSESTFTYFEATHKLVMVAISQPGDCIAAGSPQIHFPQVPADNWSGAERSHVQSRPKSWI